MNGLQLRIFAVKEDKSSDLADRRREPRIRSPRPVYVHSAGLGEESFEEVRNMRDFSRNGVYFVTERDSYHPGLSLHVVPGFGSLNLEYLGEVVRVDQLPHGEYGIAVRLLGVWKPTADTRSTTLAAFEAFARAERPADAHELSESK